MGIRNVLFVFAFLASGVTSPLPASEGWYATYEEAADVADQSGVPLLIHFHASYCGPCRQMNSQVFSQRDVQEQLRKGIAAVEVDVSERPDLAAQYGASTVPRDVVVYAGRDPETLGVGFKSKLSYLSLLKRVERTGAEIQRAIADTDNSDSGKNSDPQLHETQQEDIVGLEGFCPVKLIRDREWVSGQSAISETYRGVTYHFSSKELRDEFRKNSRKFTPQNLGCDPVVLYDNQRAVTGKIKFGAFFDNQLFLFETPDNRREFKENPLKYARIRHAIKVDELRGQRFH